MAAARADSAPVPERNRNSNFLMRMPPERGHKHPPTRAIRPDHDGVGLLQADNDTDVDEVSAAPAHELLKVFPGNARWIDTLRILTEACRKLSGAHALRANLAGFAKNHKAVQDVDVSDVFP